MRNLRSAVLERALGGAGGSSEVTSLTHRLVAARDPETGQAMSEERLVDNVLTFYLAGHETTAKALTWALYLLALAPDWQDRLAREVEAATGGGEVSNAHLDKLVLTQQVVQEAMRLYPPVPIMSRQAIADVRIDGRDLKAGTSILFPIYAIHRHRRRWDDPDAFRPERFAPEKEAAMSRYQYMPFGAGPRVCIGRTFALAEATAMLATLVRHARFEAIEGPDPVPVARITLLPKDGMRLRVAAR